MFKNALKTLKSNLKKEKNTWIVAKIFYYNPFFYKKSFLKAPFAFFGHLKGA